MSAIIDGARRDRAELRPGVEISLGGAITLTAERPRLIAELAAEAGQVLRRRTAPRAQRSCRFNIQSAACPEGSQRRLPIVLASRGAEGHALPERGELHEVVPANRGEPCDEIAKWKQRAKAKHKKPSVWAPELLALPRDARDRRSDQVR